jgi:hypothetical protein
MCLAIAVAVPFLHPSATAATVVNLGTASGFAVLAGAGITVAGAVNSTTITGDIGTYPTPSITGIGNVVFTGASMNHADDAVTQSAKTDLVAAYNDAAGQSAGVTFPPIYNLGGLTLSSGVYADSSSFGITGILTLDAGDDPNAVWIFQAGSTLTTAPGSMVVLTGGAQPGNVFWQVGTSATLGTNSQFAGTILAMDDISLTTGAVVDGRLLARNGAVTLDSNTIIPEPASTLLFGAGVLTLIAGRRRLPARA